MRFIILTALVIIGCENQFDVEETNQGIKPSCQRYQGAYRHTTVACGDYYDEVHVLCDENNNYERGSDCVNPSDILDIVRENKPCASCGCVVENVCAR